MFFKNLQIYRLPSPWAITQDQLAGMLAPYAFTPCGSLDLMSQGWVAPRGDGQLVHAVNGQFLIMLGTEKKLLPAGVINQVTKIKAAEIEEQQGFVPGRKQMKEIKEQVTDELLPRAFSMASATAIWIDPAHGWFAVDAASPARADEVLKLIFKSVDTLPLENLHVKQSPVSAMTQWLATDEAPSNFTIDQDTELRANTENKAMVRYTRHTLEVEDVRRHIEGGKQCTRLAMTWSDRISFVLTERLILKRITPLDIIRENSTDAQNDAERFDGDFLLMAGEVNKLLHDLIAAFGGEMDAQKDLVSETQKGKA